MELVVLRVSTAYFHAERHSIHFADPTLFDRCVTVSYRQCYTEHPAAGPVKLLLYADPYQGGLVILFMFW